mmetsp:Transcript_60977/g.89412  ORF Transcript_60977/g.89412 Transcript_60977/m.89412 type:complete len:228 (+) Transcript_60977:1-684(+)|eukprot:CAMPEP_0173085028 /NCGR_PEP_ID=MMETSP1102-20130122/21174_1 /TAXON_ID=49646 /ORGANISM="Geminigera sp., Strain Caron Lab Isolate" /LENGTH=227 /DNA_ID=CAMNT_0013963821 /DNA_START=1 /DNA_END=684 /DNA_ORIENTATION=-
MATALLAPRCTLLTQMSPIAMQPAPVSTLAALGLSCNKGKTAAMRAAEQGRTEHVIELCRDGSCDVNAATVHGVTATMYAACNGLTETVLALVESGAKTNAIDSRGWTAIMYAAAKGHLETVIALGKSGANVNAVNTQGRSALMYAAANGHGNCVRVLLQECDAACYISDLSGMTAAKYAKQNCHPEAVAMLEAAPEKTQHTLQTIEQEVKSKGLTKSHSEERLFTL